MLLHLPNCKFILEDDGSVLLAKGGFYSTPVENNIVWIDAVQYKVESVALKIETEEIMDEDGVAHGTKVVSSSYEIIVSPV